MIRIAAFADESAKEWEGQIDALKRNGLKWIELRGLDGRNIRRVTEEEAVVYAQRFKEAGVGVWAIGSNAGKIAVDDDFEAEREKVRHLCRLAKIFGTDKIRMFSFYKAYDQEEKVLSYLKEMVAIARDLGCTLYHENEKEIFGDTVERVEKIMESVEGLKFVYDPANFVEVGEEADNALDKLHSRCDYYHIKDALWDTKQIVPAGKGDGKVAELIRRIPAHRDTTLTVEPHLALFDGYAGFDNTELKNKYVFETKEAAFDAAVSALKEILAAEGWKETEEGFVK